MLHDQQDNSSITNIGMHENHYDWPTCTDGRNKHNAGTPTWQTPHSRVLRRGQPKATTVVRLARTVDPGLSYITRQIPSLFSLIPGLSPAFLSVFLFLCSSAFRLSLARNSSCLRASTSSSVLCLADSSFGSDCSLFSRCRIFWYSLSMRLLSLSSARRDLNACDECLPQ